MADTGINWPASWTTEFDGTLTTGGTIVDISDIIDLDMKASVEISITAVYNDYAKATGGLFVYILRTTNGTDFEISPYIDANSQPFGFEMAFSQNGEIRRTFSLSALEVSKLKILLWWKNTTANSAVAVTTRYQRSTVPVAS
ncbi:MAG TPA: hypothetical protein HPP87_04775 [Planctomycetes bacterium]|nr:hypothetical protein [Planctomycetota bacterium]